VQPKTEKRPYLEGFLINYKHIAWSDKSFQEFCVLKIARTIADLEAEQTVQADHISEAIQYRNLDRGSQFK
jgi:predicted ATPase with chaperone activity